MFYTQNLPGLALDAKLEQSPYAQITPAVHAVYVTRITTSKTNATATFKRRAESDHLMAECKGLTANWKLPDEEIRWHEMP